MTRKEHQAIETFFAHQIPGLMAVVAVLSLLLAAEITVRIPAMLAQAQQRMIDASLDPPASIEP